MIKRGLDQVGAWLSAVALAGAAFGGVYFVTKYAAKGHDEGGETHTSDHQDDGHGDTHEAEHGAAESEHAEHKAEPEHGAEELDHGAHKPSGNAHDEPGHDEPGHDKAAAGDDHGDASSPLGGRSFAARKAPDIESPRWGYRGSDGPEAWGRLSDDYAKCSRGKQQSPVDIDESVATSKLMPIETHYRRDDVAMVNTGNTVELRFEKGQYVELEGERYDLIAADFHSPSEHKIAGVPFDMEAHLVHESASGDRLTLAVLLEEGRENGALEPLWQRLPSRVGGEASASADIAALLPKKLTYYHYMGSESQPPCREGMRWYVATEPVTVSARQVDQLVALVRYNARPVQPLLSRRVLRSTR